MLIALLGTIGHVAHGKSTVVKAISGVQVILEYNNYFVGQENEGFCHYCPSPGEYKLY